MSKLSFRARALDASKPMPIYLAEELPDLPDYSAINRAVPQMPSGMEKEEESEHHLQRAISGSGLIIPTPEVHEVTDLEFYERCYPPDYKMPKQHIHMQPLWEEQEAPEYDIDSEDERWLKHQRHPELTELLFEQMMDKLERCSGQTVVTLNEAKMLLERKHDLVVEVYDYWLNKRLNTQHALILSVKTESRPGQSTNNPYLAFRRRTEKMQTRKNRKNDESSYEKMWKLRRDLGRALSLLQLVAKREQAKRDLVRLTAALADRRYKAGDFAAQLVPEPQPRPVYGLTSSRREPLAANYSPRPTPASIDHNLKREKRPYKRRKHRHHVVSSAHPVKADGVASPGADGSSSSEECSAPEAGPFAFRRKPGCYYEMPTSTLCGDPLEPERVTNDVMYEHEIDVRHRYTLTSVSSPYPHCVGFARRRLGRGGRVLLDRVATPLDDLWRRLTFTPEGSTQYEKERDEEVEFETKAHRYPKEMSRDYHTSGKHPWRHAFRQHLSKNQHLWLEDVKPDPGNVKMDLDDVKLDLDDVKLDLDDVKLDLDDVKMDIDDVKIDLDVAKDSDEVRTDVNIPQDSDISLRCDTKCVTDNKSVIDGEVKDNLVSVLRKRSFSACSDTSYDSDESLYPVEKEFESFINDVNKKWLHFRPKTPSPTRSPSPMLEADPLRPDTSFRVELYGNQDYQTTELTLEGLRNGPTHLGYYDDLDFTDDKQSPLLNDSSDAFLGLGQVGVSLNKDSYGRAGSSLVKVTCIEDAPPPAPAPPTPHTPPPPPLPPTHVPSAVATTAATTTATATPALHTHKTERTPQRKAQATTKENKERERQKEMDKDRLASPAVNNSQEDSIRLTPTRADRKRQAQDETLEDIVVSGVQLKTVHARNSPLKKHIISARRDVPVACAGVPVVPVTSDAQPQILTVAVSDSLKVRLQNHLLSTGGGGAVVGLVQNGPFNAPAGVAVALPVHSASGSAGVVSSGGGGASGGATRRTAPVVQLAGVGGANVVLAPPHAIHHVAANKLKVLHAHTINRNQVGVGRGGVVSLSALGEPRAHVTTHGAHVTTHGAHVTTHGAHVAQHAAPPLTHFFEIKAGHLAKGPHLVNVVRQSSAPAAVGGAVTGGAGGAVTSPGGAPAQRPARIDIHDAKRRQLLAAFDARPVKGNISNVRGNRVNVSVEGRVGTSVSAGGAIAVAAGAPSQTGGGTLGAAVVRAAALPAAVRAHPLRHQIHLKKTFQVASPVSRAGAGGVGAAGGGGGGADHAIVANLLHKNIQLPKVTGQKIAISSGMGVGGNVVGGGVQAIALSAHQLKRHARLVPHHRAQNVSVVSSPGMSAGSAGVVGPGGAGGAGGGGTDDTDSNATTRTRDNKPMEVT